MQPSDLHHTQSGARICLVEDEDLLSWCIDLELTAIGFEVKLARSIREGRQLLQSFEPNLFICDQGLPDGKGTDFIKQHLSQGSRVPVIMITAFTPPTLKELTDIGAQGCLCKPFDLEVLMEKVRRALDSNKNAKRQDPPRAIFPSR